MGDIFKTAAEEMTASSWFLSLGAFALAAVAGLVGLFGHLKLRRLDISERRFYAFHGIVERLNTATGGHSGQLAAIFELRKFPEYAEVSIRLLESIESFWTNEAGKPPYNQYPRPSVDRLSRLQNEIALTIVYLKGKM